MNKVSSRKFRVVSLLLPILIFLILISVSYAQNYQDITATVSLVPKATISCEPNSLTLCENVKWIYFIIELNGANVSHVNPADVNLMVLNQLGSISADPGFKSIGDSDFDGIPDILIRFNATKAANMWFSNVNTTKDFTLVIQGTVDGFPFNGTSKITIIKCCSSIFTSPNGEIKFLQFNSTGKLPIGDFHTLNNVDLTIFSPDYTHFNGVFACRNGKFVGDAAFYTQGLLTKTRDIKFWKFKIITLTEKIPITAAAVFDKFNNCFANSTYIACQGSGVLIVNNQKDNSYSRYTLDTLRFEINDRNAKVEGGKIWNDLISVYNIPITFIITKF
jgi:hypothetical protein